MGIKMAIALHDTPGVPQFIGSIPFPGWATPRGLDWVYTGWFPRQNPYVSFAELVQRALEPDHGETREVDEYPKGATCWYREPPTEAPAP